MHHSGKLIIIEGIDGSGKATQTRLLVEKLKKESEDIETFSFPRHGQKFFGLLVDDYLNNKFGDAAKLDPHISSLFFACDRWEAKGQLDDWLKAGKTVILDRYATSNMAHQLCKIDGPKEKEEFLVWLDEMEFQTFRIPRPDLVIYLDVEVDTVLKLMANRGQTNKEYINGDKDGLEADKDHLSKAAESYRFVADKYSYWKKIQCMENNHLLSKEEIHEKIWQAIALKQK